MNLKNFSKVKILVIGDLMIDKYWQGSVRRISPEAPVPVVKIDNQQNRIGGAGNVALNAITLGAETHLIAAIGDDEEAEIIKNLLDSKKINHYLQVGKNKATTTKLRIISQNQQLIRLDFENDRFSYDYDDLEYKFNLVLNKVDIVILSDYNKGVLLRANKLIESARKAGKPVIIDPKGIDFKRYIGATIITPNLLEFESVVGQCKNEEEIISKGKALRDTLNLEAILITRGDKGMTLLARDNEPLNLKSQAKEVYDVTGAGDTVVATLAVAIASGLSINNSTYIANFAGGLVVSKLGTASVSVSELENKIKTELNLPSLVLNKELLKSKIIESKKNGKKIVITNGCFDILHPGHIDYLEKARKLGDILIVAVNDDNSVKKLKGINRPINSLQDRLRMLSALKSVDWLISFSDETPESLYCFLQPDILVKGGDYREEEVAGGECIKANGGEVKIIDFINGYSTSNIIDKIFSSKE